MTNYSYSLLLFHVTDEKKTLFSACIIKLILEGEISGGDI